MQGLFFMLLCPPHKVTQVVQCRLGDPWKEGASTVVLMIANHWENPLRSFTVQQCLSWGEAFVCLCGWKVGRPSWNIYLLRAYFLDCELGHMGQACSVTSLWLQRPSSFAYGDSMEAQAHFKAQWKTNQALWIYSQISFVFSKPHGEG